MADDAGALLVRSGLVSSNALDDARARVASIGGTLGEQLVTTGAIADDDLTDFYRSRLLVPQVNPNTLARLTPTVVAAIPGDMAIELRTIPVALDGDNNLTVAMSDPSDRHAVDEIAFFTGAYVVRAVATQMQIAWCLAHYYGHVTTLGQRLLSESERDSPIKATISASTKIPRTKGLTGKVNATRHRAVAPVTGPVNVLRPNSAELDLRPLANSTAAAAPAADAATAPASTLGNAPATASPGAPVTAAAPPPTAPRPAHGAPPSRAAAEPPQIISPPLSHLGDSEVNPEHALPPVELSVPRMDSAPDIDVTRDDIADDPPERPRTRSVSGEIRTPNRRAPSIRPPLASAEIYDDDDEPQIVIERGAAIDDSGARTLVPRRRPAKSDPPELYARAGEVDLKSGADRAIDADEPRIVVDIEALAPPPASRNQAPSDPGEPPLDLHLRATQRTTAASERDTPLSTIDVQDDADTGALIHDRLVDRAADRESSPILLDRPRGTPEPFVSVAASAPVYSRAGDDGGDDDDVVVLDAVKQPRPERRTQVGIPPAPAVVRSVRDTDATGVPALVAHRHREPASERTTHAPDQTLGSALDDPTTTEHVVAPPDEDTTTSDQLAVPPGPASDDDTNPYVIAPPPEPVPPRITQLQAAVLVDDDIDDDDEPRGPRTIVMKAAELDAAIPERTTEVVPGHLTRRRVEYDPIDDGWGPPGTTIPPPLLGAIPGSEDDDDPSVIPMPSEDSAPLMVGPPSQPLAGDASGRGLVRALEDATARAIEVIRKLERTQTRDQVVEVMVAHLAETHHRAGFFVTRPAQTKGATELSVFSMTPRPQIAPFATLRLDRPSTLQDVVGTRLPYRGPMHDDASRSFLISVLGACPAEILLVPVAVRERVVGVLFGEHRQRHTFDDQVALAARAAGMALERILKARRG